MKKVLLFLLFASLTAPVGALAAGGHDDLKCVGCHGLHSAKEQELIFAVAPNTKDINPRTKQAYTGITALCLGCHQSSEKGGEDIIPISGHVSHPYNIKNIDPKVASVPASSLRNGTFECVGCHDPHPSNPNYRYLLVDTQKGAKMDVFCSVCHSAKVDPRSLVKQTLFSSMDQRKGPAASAAPAAPAAK